MNFIRFLLPVLSSCAFAACIPIHSDRILGRDLAIADARFAAVPATQVIGFAPAPGTVRIFQPAELARIARANGIPAPDPARVPGTGDACFEIPMRRISEEEVVRAMRRSLPAGAELRIVEVARGEVAAGEPEFPIAGLEPPAPSGNGAQLWRGSVKYTDSKKMQTWARVMVTERLSAVVAVRDLPPNVAIDAAALRVEARTGPIRHGNVALRVEDAVGRVPKRSVTAGSLIPVDILGEAPAVRRGDAVRVEVRSGSARLLFDAIAEKEARNGEMVDLRNPANGRTFRARLEGSKAVIVIGAEKQL
jgi:flagella basal body P-ring formation protein FlgA